MNAPLKSKSKDIDLVADLKTSEFLGVPPVSKTAWYTLGIRDWDSKNSPSICNDQFASKLMCPEARQVYANFSDLYRANVANLARHKTIDDILIKLIKQTDGNVRIFLLGAGFDTRPFRISGGRWVELDDPAVIEHKEEKLDSARCSNILRREPIIWGIENMREKLATIIRQEPPHENELNVMVYEGVFMYLGEDLIKNVLEDLKAVFPKHVLICDLLSKQFFLRHSQKIHNVIQESCDNASFKCYDNPWNTMISAGYETNEWNSCIIKAADYGGLSIVYQILNLGIFEEIQKGYSVWHFTYGFHFWNI